MVYWKLARWPHFFPGLFALVGIFYAQKLFDSKYLLISFWFFLPFLLSGIAAELLITALSIQRQVRLMSAGELVLAQQFDWKVLSLVSAFLFTVATLLANLYTKGLHSSWFVPAMFLFALVYGVLLRRLWLIDLLSFPLLYLIPLVAGTLDTMLPLYATQIILAYLFGLVIYALRICAALEHHYQCSGTTQFNLTGGSYQRSFMPYLLALCALLFCASLIYHLLDQAARLGRVSLLILPLAIFVIAHCAQTYHNYLKQECVKTSFWKLFATPPVLSALLLALIAWSCAVHWRI